LIPKITVPTCLFETGQPYYIEQLAPGMFPAQQSTSLFFAAICFVFQIIVHFIVH